MGKMVSVNELLSNPEFISWVKYPDRESDLYWKKWMQNHPESRRNVIYAQSIIRSAKFKNKNPTKADYDEVLSAIMSKPQFSGNTNKTPRYQFLKYAASIVLVLTSLIILTQRNWRSQQLETQTAPVEIIQKFNPPGNKSTIKLPDGTLVKLNSESQISFPGKFQDSLREVKLYGEAFFEVAENQKAPFVVKTGAISTKALGTSFNIDYYQKEKVAISLLTGKVLISDSVSEMILQPGDKLSYDQKSGKLLKSSYQYNKDFAWKDGVIYFENASINQVMKYLERWYGVEVSISGETGSKWHYHGTFDNQSLETVLKRISFSKKFDYQIKDNYVEIKL